MSKLNFRSTIAKYAYSTTQNFAVGVYEQLGLEYGSHYRVKIHNSKRIVKLTLLDFPPSLLDKIKKEEKSLTHYTGLNQHNLLRITGGDNRTVIVEIPKPKELYNFLYVDELSFPASDHNIPLGLDTNERQINLDFNDPMTTHVLLCGQTQSGKTSSLKYMIWALCRSNNPDTGLIIFDVAKSTEGNFDAFTNHPNLVMPVIKDEQSAKEALDILLQIRKAGNPNYKRLFVVIDELKALVSDVDLTDTVLEDITSMGAQSGIHAIVATQYPKIKMLNNNSGLVDNLTTRLCGKVTNAANSANALGLPDLGAERLTGFGEFIMASHEKPSRLVFPKFENEDIDQYPLRSFDNKPYSYSQTETTSSIPLFSGNQGEISINLQKPQEAGRPKKSYDEFQELNAFMLIFQLFMSTQGKVGIKKIRETIKTELGFSLSDAAIKYHKGKAKEVGRVTWLAQSKKK